MQRRENRKRHSVLDLLILQKCLLQLSGPGASSQSFTGSADKGFITIKFFVLWWAVGTFCDSSAAAAFHVESVAIAVRATGDPRGAGLQSADLTPRVPCGGTLPVGRAHPTAAGRRFVGALCQAMAVPPQCDQARVKEATLS